MRYYLTPYNCIAIVNKSGTSSITEILAKQFYSDKINSTVMIDGDGNHIPYVHQDWEWRSYVDQTETATLPALMVLRNPIDRFILCAKQFSHLDLDYIIDNLGNPFDDIDDTYFEPQYKFIDDCPTIKVFKFPEQIEDFCKEARIPMLNKNLYNETVENILTPKQLEKVSIYYKPDIQLFNSL